MRYVVRKQHLHKQPVLPASLSLSPLLFTKQVRLLLLPACQFPAPVRIPSRFTHFWKGRLSHHPPAPPSCSCGLCLARDLPSSFPAGRTLEPEKQPGTSPPHHPAPSGLASCPPANPGTRLSLLGCFAPLHLPCPGRPSPAYRPHQSRRSVLYYQVPSRLFNPRSYFSHTTSPSGISAASPSSPKLLTVHLPSSRPFRQILDRQCPCQLAHHKPPKPAENVERPSQNQVGQYTIDHHFRHRKSPSSPPTPTPTKSPDCPGKPAGNGLNLTSPPETLPPTQDLGNHKNSNLAIRARRRSKLTRDTTQSQHVLALIFTF